MSQFIFLTSNERLKEINLSSEKVMTLKELRELNIEINLPNWCTFEELDPETEILYCEDEDEAANIIIRENYDLKDDLNNYNENRYIYRMDGAHDLKRCEQLLEYINEEYKEIELYSLWIGDNEVIKKKEISIEELKVSHIHRCVNTYNYCISIKNKS